jgi:hypothetical protein
MLRYPVLFLLATLIVMSAAGCAVPADSGLKLVAWGNIALDGTDRGSSGNFTVTHSSGSNDYTIVWTDGTVTTAGNSIVDVQVIGAFNRIGVWTSMSNRDLQITLFVADTGAAAEAPFNFTVYQW